MLATGAPVSVSASSKAVMVVMTPLSRIKDNYGANDPGASVRVFAGPLDERAAVQRVFQQADWNSHGDPRSGMPT
jgi:hypothetical protein